MAVGCEFYDENGVLVIGLTTRVFKRVGSVSVAPGSSGSVIIPELADANLVGDYIISPPSGTTGVSNYSPDVTFNGQTMSWSFGNYRFQSPGRYLVIEYGFY